jgi:hypothetical protein
MKAQLAPRGADWKDHLAVMRPIAPRYAGRLVVVAATGTGLTPEVAAACAGTPTIAISDAYRLMPTADVLYSCDARWWDVHRPQFAGEKWSSHEPGRNDKLAAAARHGLHLVPGCQGDTFRTDGRIAYGSNSGFQAIGLAILFGAARIVLVGFNMSGPHFFGAHPRPLINSTHRQFLPAFRAAAARMPAGVTIVNATPGSALDCWPRMPLAQALVWPDGAQS